jgi:FKBP-type peptidyl-prolyl cis-trans isomerase FkpA
MKSVVTVILMAGMAVLFSSCDNVNYRKTPGGMPYKLFKGKGGAEVKHARHVKISLIQKINDSTRFSTIGKPGVYFYVPSPTRNYDITELWQFARVGDSIVTIQMLDTFLLRFPDLAQQGLKKGDRIISHIKILDVFESDSARSIDEINERKIMLESEIAFIGKYLDDKKIQAQKTPSGAFVETISPGQGNLIDSGNYISVMYKGYTFDGVVFDSNTDTTFGRTEPLEFTIGTGAMIPGFEEGLRLLRKGSEGRIYIPSLLAYGPNPGSDKIKPFESIIFDIRVLDVQLKEPSPPPPPKSNN